MRKSIFRSLSLVESFNLIELKLDRGFAAEHGNGYVYLVLIRLNRRYNADKACQRAVDNANTVACGVVYLDLALSTPIAMISSSVSGIGLEPPDLS